jgi:hypothetical protein
MLGVDFVINALLDTSGLRPGGDCATAMFAATARKAKAPVERIKNFTALILLRNEKCESGKALTVLLYNNWRSPVAVALRATRALRTAKRLQPRPLLC